MPAGLSYQFYAELPSTDVLVQFTDWLTNRGIGRMCRVLLQDGVHRVRFETNVQSRQDNVKLAFKRYYKRPIEPFVLRMPRVTDLLIPVIVAEELPLARAEVVQEQGPVVNHVEEARAPIAVIDIINGYMVEGKTVRKTVIGTRPMVSVYDLIEAVTGQPGAERKTFFRMMQEHPEVGALCPNFKFTGRGQRLTPVTDARGVVTIINLLPGRAAAAFRAISADVLVRFMGGDLTLIAEIERNAEAQAQLPADNPARLFGEDVEARVQYTTNVSTLVIESGPLPGFDGPGVYLIQYGDKLMYNLEGVPENASVIGFGHAKMSGSTRCAEHRAKTGPSTRVLDFVPTHFYEKVERKLEEWLKARQRIVKANIVGTVGVMREQFYVLSLEDYNEVLRSIQANAEECMAQVQQAANPLLIEQEKTKQADSAARVAEANSVARVAEANSVARVAEADSAARVAEAAVRLKELELTV